MINRREFIHGGILASAALTSVSGRSAAATDGTTSPGEVRTLRWPEFTHQTRPWTRWWWPGSIVTEDGLRRELDRLADNGFGGVEVQPIYEPHGYEESIREYLGAEWMRALDVTVEHAGSRNLGIDLTTGSGWTFGVPWIPPELSAGRVLVERWRLRGGQRLEGEVRTEHPPHPDLVDEERLARPEFRPPRPSIPEPPLAALIARDSGTGRTIDLTDRVDGDRKLDWTAPSGDWELTGLFSGWVLKRVERAGPGGKGLLADYFDEHSIRQHLDHFGDSLGERGQGIRALFHDSFELQGTDWTASVLEDFARLRGYAPAPYLPEVFDERSTSERRRRVLTDLRETFSDLFLERFARQWSDWSAERGWLTRNQAHGSPANLLDVYAAADIPETEYTGGDVLPVPGVRGGAQPVHSPTPLVWRMASSAAHLRGKSLVGAETMTWRDEHYHVSLSQAKPEVDLLFSAGVNHVVFHGTTYSPEEAPWPGLSFYASTELRPANTAWQQVSELNEYITRCQSVLQSGEHGNDVLVYWPQHDLWAAPHGGVESSEAPELTPDYGWKGDPWMHSHPTGADELADKLARRGWQFDWVSDRQLAEFSGSRSGIHNQHCTYAAVVVPGAELVPLETVRQLRRLAAAGAMVVFAGALPRDVPGLGRLDQRRTQLAGILHTLTSRPSDDSVEHRVGAGRAVVTTSDARLEKALADAGSVREPIADSGLKVLRRKHEKGEYRFLANLTGELVDDWFALGTLATSAAALDPLRDERGTVRMRRKDGHDHVRVRLAPGESLFLKTFRRERIDAAEYRALVPTGQRQRVGGPWRIEFLEGGPSLPRPRSLDSLASWTELGTAESEFSGTARYAVEFHADRDRAARDWLLDLGEVRETARVTLNGHHLGTAWSVPFRIPLNGALSAGRNVLEVEVTNLAANRVRALATRGTLPDSTYMQWRTAHPREWDPQPSGLLGPVELLEIER
ncbi:glycosyl hydrolase [Actinopolyspora saharensis]|uniref:Glycosyl hydrolases family 2, sugar binding domain n=1 Tax=Actinopolyspora saharensis TaxID=995062 RepID=A0A1H0ZB57_9ACTN|nr:glycosyl hydrolase [Actinopolyspora saharensis]SDQ24401.1 Glycosyl hydrolases family 2, sugar binding domain [Actinopolyspora saharensis]